MLYELSGHPIFCKPYSLEDYNKPTKMRNYTSRNKAYWNARKTSILDILVSQKRLRKPKTSTLMLWIGSSRRKSGALSNYIVLSNIITSFMILLHILHLSVALQIDNSESLQSSSTLLYRTNSTRYIVKEYPIK